MDRISKVSKASRLALFWAAVVLTVVGCATTVSYRPEIDSMKALAEENAARVETRAPGEYAAAEAVSPQVTPKPKAAHVGGAAEEKVSPLHDIFFDFDKSSVRVDMKKYLDENVSWLKGNPQATLLIEGHADERGTSEYNLGLGQRRAKSIKNYLVAAGIDHTRIKTVSYGKERPFALGHDESVWEWNRRAHFVLEEKMARLVEPSYAVVRVFYTTDRNLTSSPKPSEMYGSDRSDVSYGTCEVSIPRDHRMGELESPSVLRLEFN